MNPYLLIIIIPVSALLGMFALAIVSSGARADLESEILSLEKDNELLKKANQTKYDEGFGDGHLSAIKTVGESLKHTKIILRKLGVNNYERVITKS